jgi:hypothetical protein
LVASVASFAVSGARSSTDDTTLLAALAPLLTALLATLAPLLTALPATLAPLVATLLAALAPLLTALPATLAPLLAALPATLAPLLTALPATLAALPATLAAEDPTLAALEAMSLAASWVPAQLTAHAVAIARPPTAAAARLSLVVIVLLPNLIVGRVRSHPPHDNVANQGTPTKRFGDFG